MAVRNVRSALRRVRHELGIGQRELAGRAGISRQSLSELEAAHSCPSAAVALRLAQVLRCRVEDLFSLGEDAETVRARWAAPTEETRAEAGSARGGSVGRRAQARAAESSRVALGLVGGQWV